jgi:hypothetical protein
MKFGDVNHTSLLLPRLGATVRGLVSQQRGLAIAAGFRHIPAAGSGNPCLPVIRTRGPFPITMGPVP